AATAELPDGRSIALITIPDWDLRWQQDYEYESPIALPTGTRIVMRYTYDNSDGNPRSRRPLQRVRWGPLSSNEMADLWLQVEAADATSSAALVADFRKKALADDAIGYEHLLASGSDSVTIRNNLASAYLELGQPSNAIEHLRAAVRLESGRGANHYNLALAL